MLALVLMAAALATPEQAPALELAMAEHAVVPRRLVPAPPPLPAIPSPVEVDGRCVDPTGLGCRVERWTHLTREADYALLPVHLAPHSVRTGPPTWFEQPLAQMPHPVRRPFVREYLVQLDETLAGRTASPIFRDTVARANAHFSVMAWGVEPRELTRDQQEAMIRDLAVATSMAAEVYAQRSLHASEVWGTVHDVARGIIAPDITVRGGERTKVSLTPRVGGQRVAQAQLDGDTVDDDVRHRPVVRRPPPPQVGGGLGIRVRGIDEEDDTPFADASVYISGSRWLVDGWRLSALLLDQSWVFSAREQIYPGISLAVNVRSRSQEITPGRITTSLMFRLPFGDRLQLRTYVRRDLPSDEDLWGSWEPGIQIRGLWRWRTPQSPSTYNLGDRVQYAGTHHPGAYDPSGQQVVVPATGRPWPPR